MTRILIEPHELMDYIANEDRLVIVDTRAPDAYREMHLPGAVNLHEIFTYLSTSTPEGLADLRAHFADEFGKAGIGDDSIVVFYEDGMNTGFGQSCRGHFMLSYLGHEGSRVLHGGLKAWRYAGGAVTDERIERTAQKLTLDDRNINMVVSKDDVLAEIGKDRVTLLDVRDVDEWIGASSSPYGIDFAPRKGRLPGAKWLEWYRMMKPGKDGMRMKTPAEVRAECQNIGLDFDKPIWLYCFKGARTSNTYVALKQAGFTNISTYFGSWNEWSRDTALPIEEGEPAVLVNSA